MTDSHEPDSADIVAIDAVSSAIRTLDRTVRPDGETVVSFEAGPGLYQFSVIADASSFDWESLYVNLYSFHNNGQRTGPWDFHPTEGNRALLPSYWVSVDDRPIGLWYFQRVSIDDLTHKRFRGCMAFFVAKSGPHRLSLRPYQDAGHIRWLSALLESDTEDSLGEAPEVPADWFDRCPTADWRDPAYWQRMRERLEGPCHAYEPPLRKAFAWLDDADHRTPDTLPLLVAKFRLNGDESAFEETLAVIERALAAENWGNPKPDGYGHDGDMGAMYMLWGLAHAYHALHDRLDDDTKLRMRGKIALQGDRFFAKALLYRDYWGGSLLQDHGWRSLFGFGCAALHLLGILPEASLWAAYIIPRLDRSLEAMPPDGVIPASSHYSLELYTEMIVPYRDVLLRLTGRDLYRHEPFLRIVDYVETVLNEDDLTLVGWGRDKLHLVGGSAFLNGIAAVHREPRAIRLRQLLRGKRMDSFYAAPEEKAFYMDALWGLLSDEETAVPVEPLHQPAGIRYFEDSGVVHYRDPELQLVLSLRCGPSMGYHAYRKARGACDRLGLGPEAGHFMMAIQGEPLLVTPDSGYCLRSAIRSCLLIDGIGQRDDVGYTMSVPSYKYRGEEIETAVWDDAAGRGRVRLQLADAYPEEAGIACYWREFILERGKPVTLRDHIVLDEPRKLAWLFQTKREHSPTFDGLTCKLGQEAGMTISPRSPHLDLTATVEETPVVWSYVSHSGFLPFDTVRYDAAGHVRCAVVEFVFARNGKVGS